MPRHSATSATWAIFVAALSYGAWPAFAQAPETAQTSQTSKNAPQKSKKVWTNDNLDELSSTGGVTSATATVSSEGAATAAAPAPASAAAPGQLPPEKDPKTYRAKLEPLRKQLADLDAKIKQMQDAIDHPVEGTNKIQLKQPGPNLPPQDQPPDYNKRRPDNSIYGNEIVRPQDQLDVFEKQRQQVQQQIDDLEAQARQNGIAPGDIR
jgi:chaperonin cofactor prefoldin